MQKYFEYWENWTNTTFTSALVRQRIAQLSADPATGTGRFEFLMIPELYTDTVIKPADALLSEAAQACSQPSAVADACPKVQKAQLYITYLRTLRAAINCTNHARRASTAGSVAWVQIVDATEMVVAGRALRILGKTLAPMMIVNIHYTFAKATERGDLFGIAAARDAPASWSPGSSAQLLMLPVLNWRIKFDPAAVGDRQKWWSRAMNRSSWAPTLIGEPFQSRFGRTTAGVAWARAHGGNAYSGIGWLALDVPTSTDQYSHLMIASVQANSLMAWVDGVQTGGCSSAATCGVGVQLAVPRASGITTTFVFRLNASATGGMLRRAFLKMDDTSRLAAQPGPGPAPYTVFWDVGQMDDCLEAAHDGHPCRVDPHNVTQFGVQPWQKMVTGSIQTFPMLTPAGAPYAGGVPQAANFTVQMQLIANLVREFIPDPEWDGVAAFDYEEWIPVWESNWACRGCTLAQIPRCCQCWNCSGCPTFKAEPLGMQDCRYQAYSIERVRHRKFNRCHDVLRPYSRLYPVSTDCSEKCAKLAQKLGQLQPFIAVFPQECLGQLASFGPT
jgi:hypothetical protein